MPTPRYKIRPDTGDLQEYLFEYNGILALKNFVARVDGERLILHSAADMNFSILDALFSEVEIDGRVYDNAEAAQEALMRLTFNTNRPVLMTQQERELLQGALQKGTYVGTAADLKALIDGKVDKVPGKGLSTNDFTNAYKQKLDTLEDYDIELDEATTELKFKKGNNVVRRISLMFLDDEGTKLLYNRTAKTLELRDKRDNLLISMPVSHFVSNIPTSIVVQNGKIKLMAGSEVINENTISYNDLADKPNLNFAPAGHRHNWDDIDGKPALATEGKIQEAIGKIQVGGRNLLKNSGIKITNNSYLITTYDITTELKEGETVTLTIKGQLGAGKLCFGLYNSGGEVTLSELENKGNGFYQKTFNWKVKSGVHTASNKKLYIFTIHNNVIVDSTIEWIKLERGNTPTDWTPAPEDLLVSNNARASSSITLTRAHNNATIFLEGSTGVDMTGLGNLDSVSFRKVFAGGAVTFTCAGETIIYTGDNAFNGGDGSTAVVSIWNQKCYIDIRNV